MNAKFIETLIITSSLATCLLSAFDGYAGSGMGKGSSRDYTLSLPIMASESVFGAEMNLANAAAITLEGGFISEREYLNDADKTGNSLKTSGHQYKVLISRYSQPQKMGGFFWSLGAGYRSQEYKWRNDFAAEPGVTALVDDQNKVYHEGTVAGITGHGRIGYRYVADEWPLHIGGYIGLRHFQGGVKQADIGQDNPDQQSELSTKEEASLRSKMMSSADIAITAGFAF